MWILDLTYAKNGKTLVVGGGFDTTTTLWDVNNWTQLARVLGAHFALAPDGKTIATALTKENFLPPMLWGVQTGKQTVSVPGAHADMISSLAFFPSGTHLLTLARDGTIKCFDVRTGNESWNIAE
jgi:WD40 repeat protein